jgi:riboflavin synthase
MFTGIIREIGKVERAQKKGGGLRITVHAPRSASELRINDSVSVNGVCQTVIECDETSFTVEAVEETLSKTTLANLRDGSLVNLELPLRLDDRIGGHLVQGHVDGVGTVVSLHKLANSWLVTVDIPHDFLRYVIPIGSIAIDGVSLTIASLRESRITVSLIPHTLEETTLKSLGVGSKVNLEFDLIGKYIERLVTGSDKSLTTQPLTSETLRRWGYEV